MLFRRALSFSATGNPSNRRCYQGTTSDPLRILFCGSDDFSCASLRALHRQHVSNPGLVEALDVMVLPGKRTGRGLKTIREVPCRSLAEELGLSIHQRDTFRDWSSQLPRGTNLIVAVSFGLFVPSRILQSAKYGGLNVHPSLLPDLRGPAPIHHALLRGDTHMGVSLQTLDDKAFDHGTILAQTPAPGLSIPPRATLPRLLRMAAVEGADMLVQGLQDGLHLPPHRDVGWKAAQLTGRTLQHAPKITKADGQVDWGTWTANHFGRRIRTLGSVWTSAINDRGVAKRILFLDGEVADAYAASKEETALIIVSGREEGPGTGTKARDKIAVVTCEDGSCLIRVGGATWVRVEKVKVDGKPEQRAASGLRSFLDH